MTSHEELASIDPTSPRSTRRMEPKLLPRVNRSNPSKIFTSPKALAPTESHPTKRSSDDHHVSKSQEFPPVPRVNRLDPSQDRRSTKRAAVNSSLSLSLSAQIIDGDIANGSLAFLPAISIFTPSTWRSRVHGTARNILIHAGDQHSVRKRSFFSGRERILSMAPVRIMISSEGGKEGGSSTNYPLRSMPKIKYQPAFGINDMM